MLDTLKFVRGAVADKDLVPVLTHFLVRDGRVEGSNGRIYIDAPCRELEGYHFAVPADGFVKAIDAAEQDPVFKVTDDHLTIKSGGLRVKLPLTDPTAYPELSTEEIRVNEIDGEALLAMLNILYPFIGVDASRPWSAGVLLKDGYAYATNNIVLAGIPFDWPFGETCIPLYAIKELLRIRRAPWSMGLNDSYLGFHWSDSSWMAARLLDAQWPGVDEMLAALDFENITEIPTRFPEAAAKLVPFCNDIKVPILVVDGDGVKTEEGPKQAVNDSFPGLADKVTKFRAESLVPVLELATRFEFNDYPDPCRWRGGDGLRGIVVGVRG